MSTKKLALVLLSTYIYSLEAFCPTCVGLEHISSYKTIYSESTARLINPDRGGTAVRASHASSPVPLTVSELDGLRSTLHINLIWRVWYLDTFVSTNIDNATLGHIQDDFNTIREAGFKAIIRFAYTDVLVRNMNALKFYVLAQDLSLYKKIESKANQKPVLSTSKFGQAALPGLNFLRAEEDLLASTQPSHCGSFSQHTTVSLWIIFDTIVRCLLLL